MSLSLLAGYPPTFAAFCLLALLYAVSLRNRKRLVLPVCAAIIGSLLISAAQLVPTLEAVNHKVEEVSYGAPIPDHPRFYLSFLLPNFYNQNRTGPGPEVPTEDSMYVGGAALFGLLYSVFRPVRGVWIALTVILIPFLIVIEDPLGVLSAAVFKLPVLPDILRSYNLLLAIPFLGAMLAASATDSALQSTLPTYRAKAFRHLWTALALIWMAYMLFVARKGGPEYAAGLGSAIYTAVFILLLWTGLHLAKPNSVRHAALLLLLLLVEVRCFEVNRKGNATDGNTDNFYSGDVRLGGPSLLGLHDAVYRQLLEHPDCRIALLAGPVPTDLRFYGLTTPQGFDPFLTKTYKRYVERFTNFRTNREFTLSTEEPARLRAFGVGYVMALRESAEAHTMVGRPEYALLEPSDTFFQVFRLRAAQPAWRFAAGNAAVLSWQPEERMLRVSSDAGGEFVLLEQNFPGWRAYVDGRQTQISAHEGVFQRIQVPPGSHTLRFVYRPLSVAAGLTISALSLFAAVLVFWRHQAPRVRDEQATTHPSVRVSPR
jgi:hypothetical protein